MGRASTLHERTLISLVRDGQWEIDGEGRVWCVANRRGLRAGGKDDNRPCNLLCGTSGENVEHAHRVGLTDQHGDKNPSFKLTNGQVAQIRLAYDRGGWTMGQLAARFGVVHQTVSKIVKGERRPKQSGPVDSSDRRHNTSSRAPSGRFAPREDRS